MHGMQRHAGLCGLSRQREQLALAEPARTLQVMRLDPVFVDQPVDAAPGRARTACRPPGQDRVFVRAPRERERALPRRAGARLQTPRAAADQAIGTRGAGGGGQALPCPRCPRTRADEQPAHFARRREEQPAQHDAGHARRMPSRVRECERRAPRSADDAPACDAELRAQRVEVADQPHRIVVTQAAARRRRPRAALVDQHDARPRQIEHRQHRRGSAAAAGAAVQHDDGPAERIAGFGPCDPACVAGQGSRGGGSSAERSVRHVVETSESG
ncbi:putative endonuclease/exonuclease/phosphatase family protein [Burkholderia ambifaria MEX-5]|uniref:Putative endonuclease/exonuclease/phosphatase family protein n=1 Tax=Burkholderia ambifaria MEX-5 TaxID=396597 RepID=B1TGX0_9BURK|nr:putative endonuclease/exonuclease/phosphatase family protein [Burkholderia ambifaria MEX-5]